ncbi:OsmC family protein [Ornithinimicrobium faecis]|uniref:OsmC family protein n=1 Tax=Ornithinimicrobium faecis TaxID=2934158 RepID=A0ABY4YZ44_9MICO|nr:MULTISPECIES: OsmC family protein [unclassified Ornithinimicrobium]USQ82058.1 OsmC family protein [Ornithinimicrobium sp. HY1793]
MSSDDLRSITLTRHTKGTYEAENVRGGRLTFGDGGTSDFTPVELLLTAMAGCSAIDVDYLTSRLAEPTQFDVAAEAEKVRDEHGNHLGEVTITFTVRFPEGEEGETARVRLPDAVAKSRDRLCTVSRTVQLETPVSYVMT